MAHMIPLPSPFQLFTLLTQKEYIRINEQNTYFYVRFIHFHKEIFYTIFIFVVMYHNKSDVACCDKR
jgi:hypothetical protein